MGRSTISMAIFNSYVSLPEGKSWGKTNALGEKKHPHPNMVKWVGRFLGNWKVDDTLNYGDEKGHPNRICVLR